MNLTDDEIRVKCAEAMGWTRIHYRTAKADSWLAPGKTPHWATDELTGVDPEPRDETDEKPLDRIGMPNYPEDLNAALTLCDRLREEGWSSFIEHHGKGPWSVTFTKPFERDKCASDPSLARAICLAFLNVKGDVK